MDLATILILAAAADTAADTASVAPSDFSLPAAGGPAGFRGPETRITGNGCAAERAAEILVCGRRGPDPRAREVKPPEGVKPPGTPLRFGLGGNATIAPEVSAGTLNALPNNRVMVTVRAGF